MDSNWLILADIECHLSDEKMLKAARWVDLYVGIPGRFDG